MFRTRRRCGDILLLKIHLSVSLASITQSFGLLLVLVRASSDHQSVDVQPLENVFSLDYVWRINNALSIYRNAIKIIIMATHKRSQSPKNARRTYCEYRICGVGISLADRVLIIHRILKQILFGYRFFIVVHNNSFAQPPKKGNRDRKR